jgi:thioredoxin 1
MYVMSTEPTHLTQETCAQAVADADKGLLLCHKKLCPHCKNMEKVMEKFSAKHPDVSLFLLDSEEEPEALAALGVERVPTVLVLKEGKVAAVKTGLMNPRELTALYEKA